MARILHVDELYGWREFVRSALPDHRVDVAGSNEDARRLLADGGAYHVALVVLRVVSDREIMGAELLRLLRSEYPDTSVIGIVSSAPSAAVRDELADRFGVEEVVMPTDKTMPDLRHAIEEALRHAIPVDAPVRRAQLHRRNWTWRRRRAAELAARVRAAETVAGDVGHTGSEIGRHARTALADARDLVDRFRADSAAITDRIDRAASAQEVLDAADAFEAAQSLYVDLVAR